MRNDRIIIALDAMGGDYAPNSVLEGANLALLKHQKAKVEFFLEFSIFGNQETVSPILEKFPELKKVSKLIHCDHIIASDDKPSYAVRNSKNTSMGSAINELKQHNAHAVVSSGNTGALMAIAKLALRTLPGINRPAIAGLFPTVKGKIVALDLGANVECEPSNLVEFAIMGDAFAKVMLNKANPKLALLNIGSEDIKGNDTIKSAAQTLHSQECINFVGYCEADDISRGEIDVVVADGFTGNVAIKMAEGTAYLCRQVLQEGFKRNIFSKLGYLLAKKSIKESFKAIDGRYYNGAMLVGLNGVVVKSHGGADAIAFSNAVETAVELSWNNINQKIIQEIDILQQHLTRSRINL